jgi:glycosyltransferase involved in cell wall biosynthesis
MVLSRETARRPDIVCLSHLRWDSVYQRPHHLMSRFGEVGRVFFWEEPVLGNDAHPTLQLTTAAPGIRVARPQLLQGLDRETSDVAQARLLKAMLRGLGFEDYVLWYYTPLAVGFTGDLSPSAVVYDCMDELSGFKGASPELPERERQLLAQADLVFTGGQSLFKAKRDLHPNVHAFPSSVDAPHFRQALSLPRSSEPADQREIPGPRLGFFGVIDERIDQDLIAFVARARPEWQLVLIGPVVKIDPLGLPRLPNIHYLGPKAYKDLPAYLAGWDLALLPFAQNEATRFISPTKTPEYLAAGCPVVSTPIADVVDPYGEVGAVHIADSPERFVDEASRALACDRGDPAWHRAVDALLKDMSWDRTWAAMDALLQGRARPEPARIAEVRADRWKRPDEGRGQAWSTISS